MMNKDIFFRSRIDLTSVFYVVDRAIGGGGASEVPGAMRELEGFYNREGFVEALISIINGRGIPSYSSEMALMSIICLKNVVKRCWSQRGGNDSSRENYVLTENEKNGLKEYLVGSDCFYVEDEKVWRQVCSLIAIVARLEWTDVVPQLLLMREQAQNAEEIRTEVRTLCALAHVLEVLSEKRLPKAREVFKSLCVQCFFGLASAFQGAMYMMLESFRSYLITVQNGADTTVGATREQSTELLAMRAVEFWRVLSIVLCKGFEDIVVAASKNEFPGHQYSSDGNTCSSLPSLIHWWTSSLESVVSLLRSAQLSCMHSDAIAGRGKKSLFRLDVNSPTDESDELLAAACDAAAVGPLGGLKALLLIIRRIVHLKAETLAFVQKEYSLHFAPYVSIGLNVLQKQLSAEYNHDLLSSGYRGLSSQPSFVINATLYISNTISCSEYTVSEGQSGLYTQNEFQCKLQRQEEAALQGLNLPSSRGGADRSVCLREASSAIASFLRPENTHALLDFTLRHLLPLSDFDLEQWRDEPEQYFLRLDGMQDSASVRSAAESLFLSILEYEMPSRCDNETTNCDKRNIDLYGNRAAVEYIVGALAEAEAALHSQLTRATQRGCSDLPDANSDTNVSQVLFWDALYLCIGIGSATLAPALPYGSAVTWWNAVLAPLMQRLLIDPTIGNIQGCQILRMRFVWLLRCWFYHFDEEHHEQVLQLIVAMLDPVHASDKAVLLETMKLGEVVLKAIGSSTMQIVKRQSFLSTLATLITHLSHLAITLEQPDLQAEVVNVVSLAAGAMGSSTKQLVMPIIQHFSRLWESEYAKESRSPLCGSLLSMLSEVVSAAREVPQEAFLALFPILTTALSGSEEDAHLIPRGLELWKATMHAALLSSSYAPQWGHILGEGLSGVFGLRATDSPSLLDEGELVLAHACEVLQVYAVFCGSMCIRDCGEVIAAVYHKILGTLSPRVVQAALLPIHTLLLAAPRETTAWLHASDLLLLLLRTCAARIALPLGRYLSAASSLEQSREVDLVVVAYLGIIARAVLVDQTTLTRNIYRLAAMLTPSKDSRDLPTASERGLEIVLTTGMARLWLDLMDSVGHSANGIYFHITWCHALLSLYPSLIAPAARPFDGPTLADCFLEVSDAVNGLQSTLGTDEGKRRIEGLGRSLLVEEAIDIDGDGSRRGDEDGASDQGVAWGFEDEDDTPNEGGENEGTAALEAAMTRLLHNDPVLNKPCTAELDRATSSMRQVLGDEAFSLLLRGNMS